MNESTLHERVTDLEGLVDAIIERTKGLPAVGAVTLFHDQVRAGSIVGDIRMELTQRLENQKGSIEMLQEARNMLLKRVEWETAERMRLTEENRELQRKLRATINGADTFHKI